MKGTARVSEPCECNKLRELPKAARPYRYRCAECGKRFKILNGLNVDAYERAMNSRLGEGRPR